MLQHDLVNMRPIDIASVGIGIVSAWFDSPPMRCQDVGPIQNNEGLTVSR